MKQVSTFLLRASISFVGLVVLVLCLFFVPAVANGFTIEWPELAHLKFFFFFVPYASAIPFYIALFHALKLIGFIDHGTAFSVHSVKSLNIIKYCAIAVSIFYASGMPTIYFIADADDAPGLIIITSVIVLAPVVLATFAAVLQRLLQEAILIKSENDFTV